MIVKILPDAEYSGKFTGYIGKVKNYFSQNKKVGVELFQQTNDASSKGLFWFSESKVVAAGTLPDAMMEYIKAGHCNLVVGVLSFVRSDSCWVLSRRSVFFWFGGQVRGSPIA